ncbi:MAG: hypothetical protein GX456_18095 [Verrucomicrobia bacterium]|nr:hypothetical protein [Verrucomicrobiota bacterium]
MITSSLPLILARVIYSAKRPVATPPPLHFSQKTHFPIWVFCNRLARSKFMEFSI